MATRKLHDWEVEMGRAPSRGEVLRSIVLKHIRFREARPIQVIHHHVREDYGSISERAIHRHVAALVKDGSIAKVFDDSEDLYGYVRVKPPRWDPVERVYV